MSDFGAFSEAFEAGRTMAIKEAETAGTLRYVRSKEQLLKDERARLTALFDQYLNDEEPDATQFLPIRTVLAIINDIELVDYTQD